MIKESKEKPIIAHDFETAFNKENIQSLLAAINIDTFANINIIKEATYNSINKSILIEIPNDSCEGEIEIMLKLKQGQPTVDQVYDAIYQSGTDCQKRIITFTGGNSWDDKYNPSADMDIVKCLAGNINRFDLNLYLVQLVTDPTSSICEYEILIQPDRNPELSKANCPSIEKFTEAEFWEVYFWGYNNFIEATPFEFGFDSKSEFSQCYPVGDLELETKWTDEGAIIRIEDTSDKLYMLGDIWDDLRDEIQDMFRGCQIELLIKAGVTIKLIVKVFNKPIGDLAGVPWREKMHYAGLLWSKFTQCYEFIEKALEDVKSCAIKVGS